MDGESCVPAARALPDGHLRARCGRVCFQQRAPNSAASPRSSPRPAGLRECFEKRPGLGAADTPLLIPGLPDATSCRRDGEPAARPEALRPGDGFVGKLAPAKPGGRLTRHRSRGRRRWAVSRKPQRAAERNRSPTGSEGRADGARRLERRGGGTREMEMGGWNGEEMESQEAEVEWARTHCVGRSSPGPRPLGRRGGCAGRSPRFCSRAAWGP